MLTVTTKEGRVLLCHDEPGVPDDELDLAEELADCIGNPAFPPLSDPEMDDYVDTLAGLYAQEDDDEEDQEG